MPISLNYEHNKCIQVTKYHYVIIPSLFTFLYIHGNVVLSGGLTRDREKYASSISSTLFVLKSLNLRKETDRKGQVGGIWEDLLDGLQKK